MKEYEDIPSIEEIELLLEGLIQSTKEEKNNFTLYTSIKGARSFYVMQVIEQLNSNDKISIIEKEKLYKLINSSDEETSDLGIKLYQNYI